MSIHVLENIFRHDDGSLPGFLIRNLNPDELGSIYTWIRKNSPAIPVETTYWNNLRNQDSPLHCEENAAFLVTTGEADSFSHSISKLRINDVEVEDLSVLVHPDCLELFYKQGDHWDFRQISAMIELLKTILRIAPIAKIIACEEDGTPLADKYQSILKRLLTNKAE